MKNRINTMPLWAQYMSQDYGYEDVLYSYCNRFFDFHGLEPSYDEERSSFGNLNLKVGFNYSPVSIRIYWPEKFFVSNQGGLVVGIAQGGEHNTNTSYQAVLRCTEPELFNLLDTPLAFNPQKNAWQYIRISGENDIDRFFSSIQRLAA